MVGAWEISNAARDKTCPLTFKLDAGAGGYKLELDPGCGTAFPSLKDVMVWAMGPNDGAALQLQGRRHSRFHGSQVAHVRGRGAGPGLYFMRTQEAIKAATVSPEQVFRRMDTAQGNGEAALQAYALQRVGRKRPTRSR